VRLDQHSLIHCFCLHSIGLTLCVCVCVTRVGVTKDVGLTKEDMTDVLTKEDMTARAIVPVG
jgi:hypothetical protein